MKKLSLLFLFSILALGLAFAMPMQEAFAHSVTGTPVVSTIVTQSDDTILIFALSGLLVGITHTIIIRTSSEYFHE